MHIGAKIKLLRKEKRVTQEELAEYLHISAQAVSKWETGASSPDIDMLPKLAIFFGTSLDHLLDFDQSQVDAAVTALVAECGKQTGGDPEKGEAFLRKALEKYPNNDLLLTCLLEFLQEQNQDGARCAEIVEIGSHHRGLLPRALRKRNPLRDPGDACRLRSQQPYNPASRSPDTPRMHSLGPEGYPEGPAGEITL